MQTQIISRNKTARMENKSFSMLLLSSLLLTIGNKVYEIVLPLVMYDMTHSPVAMTSMRTAELLPNFIFGIFVGVLVDRVNKKKWVLWMTATQAILLFTMGFLFRSQNEWMFIYYMIGFLLMTFNYGYFNAQISLTKLIVPSEKLTSANAKFSLMETLVSIMGPALSGLVFLFADISNGIFISAFAYLICIVLLWQMEINHDMKRKQENFWRDLYEGWAAFKTNTTLYTMTLFIIFINCSMIVVSTTVIFYAKDVLHLSSSLLAIVLSMSGAGGGLGSLLAARLRQKTGIGGLFGVSFLLSSLSYLIFSAGQSLYVFTLGLFLNGISLSFYIITSYTIRHEQTSPHLMGRIGGITGTLFRTAMPVAMYFAGFALLWFGPIPIFIGSAIWNIVFFFIYLRTPLWKLR